MWFNKKPEKPSIRGAYIEGLPKLLQQKYKIMYAVDTNTKNVMLMAVKGKKCKVYRTDSKEWVDIEGISVQGVN